MPQTPVRLTHRLLSYLVSVLIAGQPLLPAVAATLTPTGGTSVDSAANGVPVVNIATPNGSGISHNQYQDYNVGKAGLILNNSSDKLSQTQLGGLINGNPNLKAGREAKGIINEVTGGSRSQLQGYTEVAGKAANVIVANPYGITCNGCGFINTPQATLTTGKPVFDASGNLLALDIKKGSITIEGQGIDASSSDSLSIISRATEVNAAIHAKDLNIIAGANRVNADGRIQAQQGENDAPVIAVDTGALGGMYANRIHLVSSDKGVGVNLGDLNARQGDISLDANGKLTVHNSLASAAITAEGQSITLTGDNKTGGSMTLNSEGDIALSNASLTSDNDLTLTAGGSLTQNGTKLTAGRDIRLTASSLEQDVSGQADAARDISVSARNSIVTNGRLTAGQDLSVSTDTLTQNGALVAGRELNLNAIDQTLNGAINATGNITVTGQNVTTTEASQLQGQNLEIIAKQVALNGTQAAKAALNVSASETLSHRGKSSASTMTLNATDFTNSGVAVATSLSTQSQKLSNRGLLQGDSLRINTDDLDNQQDGTLYSIKNLALAIPDISNEGLITSDGELSLDSSRLANDGKVLGKSLRVSASTLIGDGLLQGTDSLALTGDSVSQGQAGRWLTAGMFTMKADQLNTAGVLQGQNISATATDWYNDGSVLGLSSLNSKVDGLLDNRGELLSQGAVSLTSSQLRNAGRLLATGNMLLSGSDIHNLGAIQGDTLTLNAAGINNQGSAIGLNDLRLDSSGAMTNSGDLLTQKALFLHAVDMNNSGRIQGQNLVLDTASLTHSGVIQSAADLTLNASGTLNTTSESKITAQGDARISGDTLSHQGLMSAGTLNIDGGTLTNDGEISGVKALGITLSGDLSQSGRLLSGGGLTVDAKDITHGGQTQGDDVQIKARSLTNSGQIQGDPGLTLSLLNTMINQSGGVVLSQNVLSITTPLLTNDGTVQGSSTTRLEVANQTQNNGKILSGSDLSLTGERYTGNGWLQATNLVLNMADLATSGTVMVENQATLRGNNFSNAGTFQAAMLNVNYQTLTNTGTLLGNDGLTVKADSINNSNGKLFSGGELLLNAAALSGAGQLVAIGNLTMMLVNDFTVQGVIAANKQLTVTSQGDITNAGILQGDDIMLSTSGRLTINGQITGGDGSTVLNGSSITMNAGGALQSGGDVSLTSLGDIVLNGFTGTTGTMVLNAAGTLINTALLYAGNNLSLFANSIQNLQGNILAGNNLLMQRDAAGAANAEVINRSGSIETTQGDISIQTGMLLNERTGLTSTTQTTNLANTYSWLGKATANIPLSVLGVDTLVQKKTSSYSYEGSCGGAYCFAYEDTLYYYAPAAGYSTRKFALNQTENRVSAQGGSARIASGRDMTIITQQLNNQASAILADGNLSLSGKILSNQSYQSGTYTEYAVYAYERVMTGGGLILGYSPTHRYTSYENAVPFVLKGSVTESVDGEIFRAVIQAGGNATASFTDVISNENITARGDRVSNTILAPALNTLSLQSVDTPEQAQLPVDITTVAINSPEWHDQISDALLSISGGKTLDNADTSAWPLPTGTNGYFVTSNDPNSPYLITVNPKLDGLGQLDPSLFGDLWNLLGINPGAAPREIRSQYTDASQFLGSSYMLGRLDLDPDNDYRFLGDAAFDTRYVSNYVLNLTGERYINGLGSDLDQMRYLMDSAAEAQTSLGLTFGVALTAEQVAALDHSILWWESTTLNGQTVMVPKVYLSPKDVTVQSGSVMSGGNVQLAGGSITNNGSSLIAQNDLSIYSSDSISNLSGGLLSASSGLNLSALGDINNIGSTIGGKTVQLESVTGNINNITQTERWHLEDNNQNGSLKITGTRVGQNATIAADGDAYMAAAGNINLTGSNVGAGGDLTMDAGNNINIISNQINGSTRHSDFWWQTDSRSSSLSNQGSSITVGGNAILQAENDLNITASALDVGKTAQLVAGNDVNLNAADNGQTSRTGGNESHMSSADRTTISAGDNVTLVAGRDVTSQAAGIAAEGNVGIQAGRDVNLLAEESVIGSSSHSKKKTVIDESVRQQGTEIVSGGNTMVIAGRDVNSQAGQITASGDIGVAAGRDVNLMTATEKDYHYKEETKTKKGFLSKKTTHTIEEDSATREAGTLLSGDNVTVQAGNNLLVKGSSVVGDDAVTLKAGNNIDIVAATNTDSSWRFKETKKSGLMGTGGIGITIGSSKTTHDLREKGTTQSQSFSTVGSTGGDVVIAAGNQAHIGGADLIAGKDMSLSGSSVLIDPGHDKRTRDETFEQKKSGLTLALSGTVGSAINNAVTAAQDTKEESDGRLKALQATKTVLSGVQAGQAVEAAKLTADPNAMGVSLSLTTQKSKSQQHAESDTVAGSTLNAGNNLSITANGNGKGPNSGDIVIAGSQIKAGGDTLLDAKNDVILSGAVNTQQSTGKNSSSGGGIGVGIGAGKGAGISVFANVNAANGKDKGNGTDWTETTIDSGKTVIIKSGNDTVLDGAQVNGNKIVADVGHDLLMRSQQDSNKYDSKQNSVAAGGSFTFGSMTGSGYISVSQDKMKSRFDSVAEQSGLYAGNGGFDITVGNHTQLDGAVIASTAAADKNSLDTGTLGFTDIYNEADFKTQHSGISLSGGGSFGDKFEGNMPGGVIAVAGHSGHAEGTTQAAVADGSITIRDKEDQKQDVANLSRDTEHANDSISPIFDKEKEQNRLKEIGMISDIGSQVADIARTQGELNALKAAQDKYGPLPADATEEQRQAYLAKLRDTPEYKKEQEKYGTGSDIQRGIQAVTAALQGLAGGNIAGALAGASAPELAHLLKSTEGNPAVNAIAHAILGGAVAALQGNSAAAGAIGAGGGELAARVIANMLYPGVDKLSEEQKQTVSALASISAGMAGGITTGNTAGAATGASAGRNAVENNYLSSTQALTFDKELSDCRKSGGDCQAVIDKWKKVSDEQSATVDERLKDDPLTAVGWDKEVAEGGYDMTQRPGWLDSIGADVMTSDEAKAYVQQWNGQDLAKIDVNSPEWMKYAVFVSDPENQAAVASLGLLAKDIGVAAISFMSRNTATATVKASEVGMQWGQGNIKQGMPWEDYVGNTLPSTTDRLPVGFRTFDYYDASTKTAYSVKSLDTQTISRLNKPNQLYSTVKGNIDKAVGFKDSSRSGISLDTSMISSKEIQLAVPANTTQAQWAEINRAIEYGKNQGVKVKVTQVK